MPPIAGRVFTSYRAASRRFPSNPCSRTASTSSAGDVSIVSEKRTAVSGSSGITFLRKSSRHFNPMLALSEIVLFAQLMLSREKSVGALERAEGRRLTLRIRNYASAGTGLIKHTRAGKLRRRL
jgi:hypothetical protein